MTFDCGHPEEDYVYLIHEHHQTHCERCFKEAIECSEYTMVRRIHISDYREERRKNAKAA